MASFTLSNGAPVLIGTFNPNDFTGDRLRLSLILLEIFFKAWNADERSLTVEDEPKETLPSKRAPMAHPAKGLFVRKLDLHESTNGDTADPRSRISVFVGEAAGWDHDPLIVNASVHIYTPSGGLDTLYDGFWIEKVRSNKLSSDGMREMIAAARANYLGKLGEGALAPPSS